MSETSQRSPHEAAAAGRRTSIPGNLVRGALIGTVETVPGVSGGTVALVVGIYHQLIDSASHVVSAGRRLITGPQRGQEAKANLTAVHWGVVVPVMLGMVAAVFTVAGPMANLVETYPVQMQSLFLGMVLASIAVPVRMARQELAPGEHIRGVHILGGVAAAVLTFVLVSFPPASVEAHPVVIVIAAAVAVSALVLPGLSGSFLLLTFGLYEPTMRAVDERDVGYLGLFILGLTLGMICIVKILKWLLQHRHTATLIVLTGVMVGGLRSLWPWQDDDRVLHLPGEHLGIAVVLFALGLAVVAVLVVVDAKLAKRPMAQ